MRFFSLALCAFTALSIPLVHANEPEAPPVACTDAPPILHQNWEILALNAEELALGEWRFPVKPEQPQRVSDARVQVSLIGPMRGSEGVYEEDRAWKLHFHFTYPSKNPYGLPYTFERIHFSWEEDGRTRQAELDWAFECTGPGRGYFPKQDFTAELKLQETLNLRELRNPTLRIWGSMN